MISVPRHAELPGLSSGEEAKIIMNYIFHPEATEEHELKAASWQAGRRQNNRTVPVVLTSRHSLLARFGIQQTAPLAQLTPNDTLYINAHGAPGDDKVSQTYNDGRECEYSARALALLLQREGLPQNFIRIKMYSCGSAVGGNGRPPFAAQLKQELLRLGYVHVQVYGYAGLTSTDYWVASPDGGLTFDQGTHRVGSLLQVDRFYRRASTFRRLMP